MSRSLYVRKVISTKHDVVGEDWTKESIFIGDIRVGAKYTQYFDDDVRDGMAWDYLEYTVASASFVKPPNFPYGEELVFKYGTINYEYSPWTVVSVPDNFQVPPDLIDPDEEPGQTELKDIYDKEVGSDGRWTFDWSGAAQGSSDALFDALYSTGVQEAGNAIASTLFPNYKNAFENALNAGLITYDIQSSGSELLQDLIGNFESYSAADVDRKTAAYFLGVQGTLAAALAEEAGISDDLALSIIEGTFGGLAITVENFKESDGASGSIQIGPPKDVLPYYRLNSTLYVGSYGDDEVTGSMQDDVLIGGVGVDTLYPGPGADLLIGGTGIDRASYDAIEDYEIRPVAGGWVVELRSTGEYDSLRGVERLWFEDSRTWVALDIEGAPAAMYRLYQAAFARDPDKAGLGYWIRAYENGADLTATAQGFIASEEFRKAYGAPASLSNTAFVDLLYANVLGRQSDGAGKAYWVKRLDGGDSRESVLVSFSESPENKALVAPEISHGIEFL